MIKFTAAIMAASMVSQPVLAQGECIEKRDFENAVVAALPVAFDAARIQCDVHLPKTSALRDKGDEAADRYSAEAESVKAEVEDLILRIVGPEFLEEFGEESPIDVAAEVVNLTLSDKMDAESCLYFNNLWGPISDFSGRQIAGFVVGLLDVVIRDEMKRKKAQEEEVANQEANEDSNNNPFADIRICPFIA